MNILIKLSKQDIKNKYLNKPILVVSNNYKKWYIVDDVYSYMPLHMLTAEESDMYDKDEESINGIRLTGDDEPAYVMWINFHQKDGWEAYGYE